MKQLVNKSLTHGMCTLTAVEMSGVQGGKFKFTFTFEWESK